MKAREWIPKSDLTEKMREEAEQKPFFATKRGQNVSSLILVMVVAIFLFFQLNGTGGSVTHQLDQDKLGVACMDYPAVFVAYQDIMDLELVTSLRMDRTIESEEWDSGWCGTYENEEYGTYTLFAYSGTGEYIVIHDEDGVLIFNEKTPTATERVYEELQERCER
jgi:hypothetical protein